MKHTKLILTFLLFTFLSTNLFAQYAQWVSRYNGTGNGNDGATSIAVDDSGNVYVTGNSTGIGTGTDCITIKYNSAGVQQWVQRYNGPGNSSDVALSIGVDNSGNVYVAGCSVGSGTGNDYLAIKYNSNGDTLWVRRYNGTANTDDNALSAAIDGMGNVHLTGYSAINHLSSIYVTIKYNSAGVLQWIRTTNTIPYYKMVARSIALDNSGNVYVTGETGKIPVGMEWPDSDYLTIKYNSAGSMLWYVEQDGLYQNNTDDRAYTIGVDILGYVYVYGKVKYYEYPFITLHLTVGYSSGGGFSYDWNGYRFFSFRADNSGNMYADGDGTISKIRVMYPGAIWSSHYGSSGSGNSVAVDSSNNVYVTGSNGGDYVTLKYNSSGVQQWVSTYNGPGNGGDGASSIEVDNLGNVYVTGSSAGIGTGNDYATIKYSTTPPILNAFNLSSPPDGTQINTSPFNDTLVHMKWTRSGAWTTYKWKFGSPTIAYPLLTFEANNCGYDSVLSIRKRRLDSALASHGVQPGDSIVGEWAVWAYNGVDSLKSEQTWTMILKRITSSVLFYDPFMYGTGKWTITNNGGTCVWQIFSTPYPNAYTLPPTSVSPVFSADADECGIGTTTGTTATVTNNINCVGYENISLDFDNDWNALDAQDSAIVEASYNGGSTWVPIISWGGTDVRNTHEYKPLPGAANIPNLKVRFRSIQPGYDFWWTIDNVLITGDFVTGVTKNEGQIPTDYALSQNYPNPFNPSTKIKFDIPKSSLVKLIIYDVLGREIKTLVDEKLNAGRYEVNWNGSGYPSGVYFYKMVTGDFVDVKKMILVK